MSTRADRVGRTRGDPRRAERHHREGERRSAWNGALRYVLLGLPLWISLLRFPVVGTDITTEDGWKFALAELLRRRSQIGVDWIFTYGPLGFFMNRAYDEHLFVARWLWELAIKAAFTGMALWCIHRQKGLVVRGLFYSILLCLPAVDDQVTYVLLVLLSGLLLLRSNACASWIYGGIGGLLSLLALVTFPLLVLGVITAGLVAVDLWLSKRRRMAMAWLGTFALGFAASWSLIGQSLRNLPAYLNAAIEMSRRYGDAMSIEGSSLEMGAAVAILGFVAASTMSRRWTSVPRRSAALCALLLAMTFLLFFKEGFTRQDDDHTLRFFAFAFPAILIVPVCLEEMDWQARGRQALLLAPLLLALGGLWHASRAIPDATERWPSPLHNFEVGASGLVDPTGLKRTLNRELASLRESFDLPRLRDIVGNQPVDVLSNFEAFAFLNRMNWSPRYCFQSYAAYSDPIAQRNAEHFAGPQAPAFVIADGLAIDGRLPTVEDGASIVRVLHGYRPVAAERGFLLLKRIETESPKPLSTRRMSLGPREFQDVAAGDNPLVIRVVCRQSLWGRLRSVFFRSPVLFLRVQTADGASYDLRVLPSLERAGFHLSPLLLTIDDWIDAYAGAGAHQRVIRIQLCEPEGNNFYERFDVEVDVLPAWAPPRIDGSLAAALHADALR